MEGEKFLLIGRGRLFGVGKVVTEGVTTENAETARLSGYLAII